MEFNECVHLPELSFLLTLSLFSSDMEMNKFDTMNVGSFFTIMIVLLIADVC